MRTAFEHEGDIRGIDILAALVGLWREGASGSLQFSRPGATAGFEIAGGELLASSSSDPRFETAAILVRAGKLDARTLERLAAPEGADRALLALQAGVLTRREWRWGEKIRGVEILSDLLTWIEGQYWFLRKNEDERDGSEARLPIPRLVLELFLRSRDRSLVVKHLGGADVPLARAPHFDAEFATFGLTADAESVVRLIDGRASAEDIAREAPAEAFAIEKLLAALVTLGLVHPEFAGEASTATRAIATITPAASEAAPEAEATPDEPALVDAEIDDERDGREEFEAELPDDEEEVVEETEAAAPEPEGPTELEGEPDWEDVRASADTGAPLDEAAGDVPRSRIEPDLEAVSFGRPTGLAGEAAMAEFESGRHEGYEGAGQEEWEGATPPLDSSAGAGGTERPERRTVSPLLWVLAGLLLTVGLVLVFRARSARAPETEGAPGAAPAASTPLPEATVASAPTNAPAAEPSPAPAPPTAAPTAAPAAPTAAPKARAGAPNAAKAVPPAAEAKPGPEKGNRDARQYWVDRAARDAQRLATDHRTRFAVQLELACEVPSLVEAFHHDRGGNMWVLATPYQDRTCFRVLWGRYPTIEAARRGIGGAPRFFSTPKNRPAVTGVR